MKILIMGLPGSGKTTLAASLKKYLEENSSVQTMPTRAGREQRSDGNGAGVDD